MQLTRNVAVLGIAVTFTFGYFSLQAATTVYFSSQKEGLLELQTAINKYANTEFNQTSVTELTTSVAGKGNIRHSVIVYLVAPDCYSAFSISLASAFKYFNRKYRHKVLIFLEKPTRLDELRTAILSTGEITTEEVEKLLIFEQISLELPAKFVEKHGSDPDKFGPFKPVFLHRFPGYHHVLSFFLDLFDHPAMANVEYFWRFDTDSRLMSPVNYDVFDYMKNNSLFYGYRQLTKDSHRVATGLGDFVNNFLKSKKISPIVYPGYLKFEKLGATMFYNNFEILHVPTFRDNKKINLFNQLVHESLGIYEYRWGDAPLRYLQVSMFLGISKGVHLFCDIDYFHRHHFEPTCTPPM